MRVAQAEARQRRQMSSRRFAAHLLAAAANAAEAPLTEALYHSAVREGVRNTMRVVLAASECDGVYICNGATSRFECASPEAFNRVFLGKVIMLPGGGAISAAQAVAALGAYWPARPSRAPRRRGW